MRSAVRAPALWMIALASAGCSWNWDAWDSRRADASADTGGDTSTTDASACGALGQPCCDEAGACSGTLVCASGVCGCAVGTADCNSSATDGCEVDTTSDTTNCGTCFNRCHGRIVCVGGVCQ